MKRQIGKYWRPFAAIIGLILIAALTSAYILTNQRLRFPFISDKPVRMYAEMENAQSVTPGQGQTVQIAGVKIGDIGEVKLRQGRAIVALDLQPKYKDYIHTDARATLRPRTGLKDMYIQVYPGSNDEPVAKKGFTIPIGRTMTDVDLDEILSSFDADTRDYLQLFINGAGEGLKGRGKGLAEVFRRFEPTFRDLARVNKAVGQEKAALRTTITSLAQVTSQLNKRPQQITRLVDASAATFEAFASEDQNLRSTVRQLPGTLAQASQTLDDVQPFANELGPTARRLIPVFNALERANAATRPLGREATPIVRDQIRPFVRQSRPLVRDLRPAAQGLNRTFPDLTRSLTVLNTFFNMLGYNDKGRQGPAVSGRDEGYLFWLGWVSHQATNLINIDDANGPMRPIFLTGTCTTLVKLVQDRPELEFGMALSPILANLCGNPATSSINLPQQRKQTRAVEKLRADEKAATP